VRAKARLYALGMPVVWPLSTTVPRLSSQTWSFTLTNRKGHNGQRAGWVQKLSMKGYMCKTWEGEMAMVSLPGSIAEKFIFTV